MKRKILLSIMMMALLTLVINSNSIYAQRGGRGGGFSRGGFGFGRSFGGGSASFGVGINRSMSNVNRVTSFGGQGFLRSLPRHYQTIHFGGLPYYFYNGLFFDFYGGYYRSIFPPLGLTIGMLPYGYWGFNYGGYPYYYHTGIYYQQADNVYKVVQAPIGASVPNIPKDAKVVVLNNEKYFEYNGTYYKEFVKEDGSIWYLVAGLNGVLNTDASTAPAVTQAPTPEVTIIKTTQYVVGDILDQLPVDCKVIVLNNKKYYVSPANIYFEEFIENNTLKYKVVGK
jgi:hypothetical protein